MMFDYNPGLCAMLSRICSVSKNESFKSHDTRNLTPDRIDHSSSYRQDSAYDRSLTINKLKILVYNKAGDLLFRRRWVDTGWHPRPTPPRCAAEDPNEFPTRRWSFYALLGLSRQKVNGIGQDVSERRSPHLNLHGVKYSVVSRFVDLRGMVGC